MYYKDIPGGLARRARSGLALAVIYGTIAARRTVAMGNESEFG